MSEEKKEKKEKLDSGLPTPILTREEADAFFRIKKEKQEVFDQETALIFRRLQVRVPAWERFFIIENTKLKISDPAKNPYFLVTITKLGKELAKNTGPKLNHMSNITP